MPSYVLKRINGTKDVMNGDIVGSLKYDGVNNISGVNGAYFRLPKSYPLANANSWEFKFNALNIAQGGGNALVVGAENNHGFFIINVYQSVTIYLSSNDTSWDIANATNTGLPYSIGKSYYYKVGYDGTQYYTEYNEDGSDTYTRTWSLKSDKKITGSGLGTLLGYKYITNGYWANATVDLTKCSLTVDSEVVWTGMKQVPKVEDCVFKRKINKYYKDTVTTKYWKEVETTVVEYACYYLSSMGLYYYAKMPLGSLNNRYNTDYNGFKASSADGFIKLTAWSSIDENAASLNGFIYTRSYSDDLTRTTTEVVEGTPDDYTYTTTETETVEVSANDDYDRVVVDSEPAYFLTQRGNWQPVYEDYTLPKMTSRTAPEGTVSTNIGNGEYTIDAYNFFFNRSWYFEAEGREGSRYNRYTFAKPLKPDTYTISFGGNLQGQDSNSGTLSVWYDDGTVEELISYTLSTAGQTFSKTFTATKPIRTISIDMTVNRRDNKNDVTTFYGLNIVSETGQLQVFTGYKQDKE